VDSDYRRTSHIGNRENRDSNARKAKRATAAKGMINKAGVSYKAGFSTSAQANVSEPIS